MTGFVHISIPARSISAQVAAAIIARARAEGDHAKADRIARYWREYLECDDVF